MNFGGKMPIIGKQDWNIRIRGIDNWKKFLSSMEKKVGINSDMAKRIGETAIQKIKQQVDSQQDMFGRRFVSYTPKYAKKKKTSPNAVNMQLTRAMIQSLRHYRRFERNKTVITVSPFGRKNQVKAWVHHVGAISGRRSGRFRMPKRQWFGLQVRNRKILIEIQTKEIERFLASRSGQRRLF